MQFNALIHKSIRANRSLNLDRWACARRFGFLQQHLSQNIGGLRTEVGRLITGKLALRYEWNNTNEQYDKIFSELHVQLKMEEALQRY
jgi:hypothetical protein